MEKQFSQQVNFFRDEFKKKVIFLSSLQIAIISGSFIVVFSILSIVQMSMMDDMEKSADVATNQKQRMSDRLAKLEESFVEPKEDPALRRKIAEINENIKSKKVLVTFLGGQSSKKTFSFSSVMNGLSEKSIKGVWLTEFSIKTDGSHYRLVGNTQHPDLIPQYIDRLKTSEILIGTSFSLFDLERSEKGADYLRFILSSEVDANEPAITSR